MARVVYTASLTAEQLGDIVLDPKSRLGGKGTLDTITDNVLEGGELATMSHSEDGLTRTVNTTGGTGLFVVEVVADKNMDPDAEDNEVAEFQVTIVPAGTETVAFNFGNVRNREAAPEGGEGTEG